MGAATRNQTESSRRWPWIIAGMAGVGVVAFVLGQGLGGRDTPEPTPAPPTVAVPVGAPEAKTDPPKTVRLPDHGSRTPDGDKTRPRPPRVRDPKGSKPKDNTRPKRGPRGPKGSSKDKPKEPTKPMGFAASEDVG
jgi:hypothetical protein